MKRLLVLAVILSVILACPAFGAKFQRMTDEQFLDICKTGEEQEIVRAVKSGANSNAKDNDGMTPLMFAVKRNHIEAVKALLIQRADINAKDNDGKTPLMHLLETQAVSIEAINIFLQGGADINARSNNGVTPLMFAVTQSPRILSMIIKAGARINAVDIYGVTALMRAAEGKNPNIVRMLIEAKADVRAKSKEGLTPLIYAARTNVELHQTVEIVHLLIDAGAEDVADNNGKTALMYAAAHGKADVVNALIDAGSYVKAKDKSGKTVLDYARENGTLKDSDAFKRLEELSR